MVSFAQIRHARGLDGKWDATYSLNVKQVHMYAND